ncbi:2-hydroxychromene-2-carboxylate isomerase [Cupriavidus cauae]|uniref:2-hydroxychromene-2-carboxylate isomerase n=1 Tax=Cupriavidus TaxID=106589 RepID=UPI001CF1F1D7|nr:MULTISPECIES: 2-hydroxychromene-2-carboxylate isomerase [Cupriavidus]MCA7085372.1 2-hydroxychromene-2-carboxylate isomerase [Cupriavidus sp. DB3]UZN50371.1 2-hydroxychromene-2-carboxylate isomerase [Cupriavidus cauae]
MASPIDFYFDFISPYGYFGSTQIDALAARHGRTVLWRPFLLGVTVVKIMGLKPLMETPLKSDYLRLDKPRMARILGVPFVQRDMRGVSSVKASRAFLALDERDPAQAKRFAQRVFARLWARGEDITDLDAVLEEAAAVGADTGWLAAEIASPEGKRRLEAAVDHAVAQGVFGAPFFIVDGEPVWGVDRLWLVERLLSESV